ncbi:NUDIX domain-containing protein [Desulfopila sp. IMCC35008]|uniref:NUDIX domain-containing protein n=1 Tax=Desulfopila sp. IMCC35008 TaxID=2653858 RepID=UPI0013D11CA9|nr:NUDIX domain-containing protein [Desulfopila sp. IMCC35008]
MIVVAAAIVRKNGLILAARKKRGLHLAGYWEFPGGKVEPGESPRSCLQRELKEELDITCKIGDFLGESLHDYGSKHIRLLGYYAVADDSQVRLSDHDRICWLPPDKLHTLNWAPADIPLVERVEADGINLSTIRYYDNNAYDYILKTRDLNMSSQWRSFIALLPDRGYILDLGCGSGRDSRHFLDQGFRVTAVEPSPVLAAAAEDFLGQTVEIYGAQQVCAEKQYDGIWACASLIHLPHQHLSASLTRLAKALKQSGILYISYKLTATEDRDKSDLHINIISRDELISILTELSLISVIRWWKTTSNIPNSDDIWLNILCRRN